MQPNGQDYKQLLTEVIKKQIVILGPDITLSKARNVPGLKVSDDGTVTDVSGSPQEVTQALIDQFVQLSGLIVKKTMEPLLAMSSMAAPVAEPTSSQQTPPPLSRPVVWNPTQPTASPAPNVILGAGLNEVKEAASLRGQEEVTPEPGMPDPGQARMTPVQPVVETPTQPTEAQPVTTPQAPDDPTPSTIQSPTSQLKPADNPLAA